MTGKRTEKNKPGAGPPKINPLQKRIVRNFSISPKILNIMYFMVRQYRIKKKKRVMHTSLIELGILLLASMDEGERIRILEEHSKNRLLREKTINDFNDVKEVVKINN